MTQDNNAYYVNAYDNPHFTLDTIGAITHNYHLHPLLQMDSLEALAKRLIAVDQCRFIAPNITIDSPFDHKNEPVDGRSIEDVFKRIGEPGSWVALYSIDADPVYKEFVWGVLGSARHLVADWDSVFDVRGYIFISAPPSVTPFHIDRENNFWLQIHGRKKISVWDRHDSSIVSTPDVEKFIISGGLDNVVLKKEMIAKRMEFDCGPGNGVYFPSTTPHMTQSDTSWVKPGDNVTVSIGLTFYNKVTRKAAYVHSFNNQLRRLGMHPSPPHKSQPLDAIKYPLGRVVVGMRRMFRHYESPNGF